MLELFSNILNITWQQAVMWVIGGVLIYLAIAKDMEPTLLLPMGFGAILVNLPLSGAVTQGAEAGIIDVLFGAGIANELFPLLLFVGIGAMIDFTPLLTNPKLMIFGAAAQFGIFFTLSLAAFLGFDLKDAASIAIIGAADGPTSIFVANFFNSKYIGAIMVAAYSYMALVPIIQPPVIRAADHEKRAAHPHGLSPEVHFQAHEDPLPHRHHHDHRHCLAAERRADRLSDVRQPDPRVRRAGFALRNRAEGAAQSGDALPRPHHRDQDAGRVLPDRPRR